MPQCMPALVQRPSKTIVWPPSMLPPRSRSAISTLTRCGDFTCTSTARAWLPWIACGAGTRAVLEVRSHDVPFLIEDGQTVCRLIYERMTQVPERLYGAHDFGSNYQGQGLKLSKHFRELSAN